MKWPSGMEPGNVAVHVRNEIEVEAAPERVWRWLVAGERWPQWYGNCATFHYLDRQPGPDLAADRCFEWRTFGTRVRSVVRAFEPFRELGWDARSIGLYSLMDAGADRRGMPRSHRRDAARMGADARAMVPAPDAFAGPSGMAQRSAPRGRIGRPAMGAALAPGAERSAFSQAASGEVQ